jgi:hypothetical protein
MHASLSAISLTRASGLSNGTGSIMHLMQFRAVDAAERVPDRRRRGDPSDLRADRDWLKNISATGHARIKSMGKSIELAETAGDAQGRGGVPSDGLLAGNLPVAALRAGGAADAPLDT